MLSSLQLMVYAFWTIVFTMLTVKQSGALIVTAPLRLFSAKRTTRPTTWLCSFNHDDESSIGNDHDTPLHQYKATVQKFETTLLEATQSIERLEALSKVVRSIELLDPDIATALLDSPDIDDSGDHHTRTYITLEEAVQQALDTSEATGRLSLETELAWYKVGRLNQQMPTQQQHALLSHPSFRYNYAQHMLSSSKTRSSTLSSSSSLQKHTFNARRNLDKLQETVESLQHHLAEQEQAKKEFLARLLGTNSF
jgi:hypothetical protein